MEDTLVIGYDQSKNEDFSVLTVVRHTGITTEVVNTIYGYAAEQIYRELTQWREQHEMGNPKNDDLH